MTSPQCAAFNAACRSPPAFTLITDPGAGVSDIALGTVALGNSAGPSKLPPATTLMLKLPVAVLSRASETITTKLNVPIAVGMPAKSPLEFIAIPGGGVPAEIVHA